MRASLSIFASLRSTVGVRSRRIDSANIFPSKRIMAGGNHEPSPYGIPQRPHESVISTGGITHEKSSPFE